MRDGEEAAGGVGMEIVELGEIESRGVPIEIIELEISP